MSNIFNVSSPFHSPTSIPKRITNIVLFAILDRLQKYTLAEPDVMTIIRWHQRRFHYPNRWEMPE